MASQNFRARLLEACERHSGCPDLHHGRQVWLRRELAKRGVIVSVETVRKWLAGESQPRETRAKALADVLEVDFGWLIVGFSMSLSDNPYGEDRRLNTDDELTLPIPLRPGAVVKITGLPYNLTKSEAQKIANIVIAHAMVE
jgi:transcriptional regulator with XRE-family HTH domain